MLNAPATMSGNVAVNNDGRRWRVTMYEDGLTLADAQQLIAATIDEAAQRGV